MQIDWAALINSIRSLISKVRDDTSTITDWVDAAYLIAAALKAITSKPVIGSATHAAALEHDPLFASADDESAFISAASALCEELSGEPVPMMANGRIVQILLPLLIKYLLPLLLQEGPDVAAEVLSEGLAKLVESAG